LEYSLSSLLLRYQFNVSTSGQSGADIENAKRPSGLGANSSNRPPAPLGEPERPVQNGIDRTVIALWLGVCGELLISPESAIRHTHGTEGRPPS